MQSSIASSFNFAIGCYQKSWTWFVWMWLLRAVPLWAFPLNALLFLYVHSPLWPLSNYNHKVCFKVNKPKTKQNHHRTHILRSCLSLRWLLTSGYCGTILLSRLGPSSEPENISSKIVVTREICSWQTCILKAFSLIIQWCLLYSGALDLKN